MFTHHRLAEVASLVGDPARAAMVLALWDGRARPAGELARIAGVSPATASAHLAKLVSGGLLTREPRGRHRDYRLAGPRVAHALEALAGLVPLHRPRADGEIPAIRRARLCYDHVAGQLGVALSDALVARRVLGLTRGDYAIRPAGRTWLVRFGVPLTTLAAGRRPLVRACLDWTERREHLGGAVGAALAGELLERGWIARERDTRALRVTDPGRRGLRRLLDLRLE
jgi:DNA-binding transcriptional ArsR family regulator